MHDCVPHSLQLLSHAFRVGVGRQYEAPEPLALLPRTFEYAGNQVAAHSGNDHDVGFPVGNRVQPVPDAGRHFVRKSEFLGKALRLFQAGRADIRRNRTRRSARLHKPAREFSVVAAYVADGVRALGKPRYFGEPFVKPDGHQSKSFNFLRRLGWRSFLSAFASICLMRSRVTLNSLPTSSRVRG